MAYLKKHPVQTAVFGFAVILTAFAAFAVYWLFYDLQRLPTEEMLFETKSPDGRYALTLYRNNGGATVPFTLSGELTDSEKPGKRKIIYWAEGETAETEWLEADTVRINGVVLHARSDTYDYRHP